MIALLARQLLYQRRKGMDKPVWVVSSIVLAVLMITLWYGVVQGWVSDATSTFIDKAG